MSKIKKEIDILVDNKDFRISNHLNILNKNLFS